MAKVRMVITGDVEFVSYTQFQTAVKHVLLKEHIDVSKLTIVSNIARGPGRLAMRYAIENHIDIKCIPADWAEFGRQARVIRDTQMAEYAAKGVALVFWNEFLDNTRHTVDILKTHGLKVYIAHYTPNDNY